MKGFIRIGSDPLHDSLLSGLDCVEIVPSRFRKQSQWVELIRYGVLVCRPGDLRAKSLQLLQD